MPWLKILPYLAVIIVLICAYFYIRNDAYNDGVADQLVKQEKALEEQKSQLIEKCEADKKLTSEVSRDYQTKISSLSAQLSKLKRLQDNPRCVPTISAGRHNEAPSAGVDAGQNGIMAGSLLDFAGEAEQYRLQLIGCQDFIHRVFK